MNVNPISNDDAIDGLLTYCMQKGSRKKISAYLSSIGYWGDKEVIKNRIKTDGLAEIIEKRDEIIPNEKTRIIHAKGGYNAYNRWLMDEMREKEQMRSLEKENVLSQTKINKWKFKKRYWPYIISILSLIVSIIALIRGFYCMCL